MKKKILKSLLIILCLFFTLFLGTSCGNGKKNEEQKPITILFTNDVHCSFEEKLSYSNVAHLKKECLKESNYVTLVDCGDHVEGTTLGTLTKGEGIIKIMNETGYDLAIFGNHEFGYGLDQLEKNINQANFSYLACNISYNGKNEHTFLDYTKSYEIITYGPVKIAYVGVTTPLSLIETNPNTFKENDEYVIHFGSSSENKTFIDATQEAVNNARKDGADYVVVLSHLGWVEEKEYGVQKLISSTTGIDVVLDGHSHTVVNAFVANKSGEEVLVAQTGTGFENIGKLVISKEGFECELISEYTEKDVKTEETIQEVKEEVSTISNQKVAYSSIALSIYDEENIRLIRNREMAIGDFVADAYRYVTGADIAYVNGGGIRASLPSGDITYGDIINVNPFGNMICMTEVTGAQLLDMLEYFYRDVQAASKKEGKPVGEHGSFGQISGLKVELDLSIPTSAVMDGNDNLISVGATRRVTSCKVLQGSEYVDIDPTKTYTFASHSYCIKNGGCGMETMLKNTNVVLDSIMPDYQALITYMTEGLKNDLTQYATTGNRITFK